MMAAPFTSPVEEYDRQYQAWAGQQGPKVFDLDWRLTHLCWGDRALLRGLPLQAEPMRLLHRCHGEYASQAGDRALVERTLRDGVADDARIDAALEFLTAFASGPTAITAGHLDRLLGAGVRDEAIRDLAQIAFSFSLINRVADALEFRVPGHDLFARSWPRMRDHGYRF